jgi:CheY-like chemotaxis protein
VVEIARSGPEGLAKAKQFAPELVLCDIGLPDLDGDSIARAFRSYPALRSSLSRYQATPLPTIWRPRKRLDSTGTSPNHLQSQQSKT